MTKFKLFGAAAVLSALIATPTLAEPMNQEHGLYSFYHPNSDPNVGSAPAPVDAMALDLSRGSGVMVMKMKSYPARARH